MSRGTAGHHTLVALEKVEKVPDHPSDPLQGISVIEGGTGVGGPFVIVTVRYAGGDKEHSFRACWDGSWLKSNPPGISVQLLHDANGDQAKANISKTLQINLSAAVGGGATYAIVGAPGLEGGRADVEL